MTGRRIKTLAGLWRAVQSKQSVVCPNSHCWRGPRPAAFMINQQGTMLLSLFRNGMYLYKKEIDHE